MDKQVNRTRFKGPEGVYQLYAEKASGTTQFNYHRPTRLTLASLASSGSTSNSEDGTWIIYNVGDQILLCRHNAKVGPQLSLVAYLMGGV